jgi:formylglycine-generating enzyme required for sulfatase activity
MQPQSSPAASESDTLTIVRQGHRVQCFTEPAINLALVLIPGGRFLMGSPPDEIDRFDDEGPQHEVTVPPFLMGRYPITQSQWRAIASRQDLQVKQSLDLDPSHFKGDDHPVEQVSWYEVVEFCDRLSRLTRHSYRLPSEAEWEYACRASPLQTSGTPESVPALRTSPPTPFHFGETITTDLANYDGADKESGSYGRGSKGVCRQTTTPVNHFHPLANAFGLCDLHGNVFEWCLDHWHDNYDGAPTDGSAWLTEDKEARRVRRGGSWSFNPRFCRSASRSYYFPDFHFFNIGFRVVCEAPGL